VRGGGRAAEQLRISRLITLYAAMLVTLGFLIAALLVVVLLPAYRRRIERFTTEVLKRTLPLTEEEIRADKDRMRADFAMEVHRLEKKVEEAGLSAARQSVEINRRDAKIQELTQALADHKMTVDEHENARRVLEQAILDRLPKVEQRLAETRKLLAARDREIRSLLATSAKQAAALEEAGQINAQRDKELAKLRTALETRAWRNRSARSDDRADSSVALRTELEALRTQNRDQADLIARLQGGKSKASLSTEDDPRDAEIKRLTLTLAKAEAEIAAAKASGGGDEAERMALEDRLAELQASNDAKSTELAKLKAALKTYEEKAPEAPGIVHKADLSAVQVEVEEQRRIIAALRAEIAASQERLSRQAAHFHDELRQMGGQSGAESRVKDDSAPRKPLAERILAPHPVRSADHEAVGENGAAMPRSSNDARPSAYLRALKGSNGSPADPKSTPSSDGARPPPLPAAEVGKDALAVKPPSARRPRLLERISGLDKR
jgi:chromosome segregation ATPase